MLEKLLIIYTFITTLNPANKLSTCAVLNGQYYKGKETTEGNLIKNNDMETWQPIIQTRNWLIPTPAEAATSSSSVLATSTPLYQTSSLSVKFPGKPFAQQQRLTLNQYTNNNFAYNHRSGNYSKFHETASSPISLSPSNTTNIKLKPYASILHRQQQHYPLKHIVENIYPKTPVDIISKVKKSHMQNRISNFIHNVTMDVNQHESHSNSNNSTPNIYITNVHNPIDSIKPLNTFETNKHLIDSKLKNSVKLNTTRRAHDNIESNIVNLNEKLLPLQTTFDYVKEFYDGIQDIVLSDKDNVDDFYSNEDKIHNDYGLPMLNLKADDVVISKPSTTSSAAATMTENIPLLTNRSQINLSSIGEVQGHKRQINEIIMLNNPLISSLAKAASSSELTTQLNHIENKSDTAATQTEITARRLMWNKSTPRSSSSSPSLQTVVTGRKIKKFKKKFQKFLLPLVLAYKLKFLALIPLLMGGLTLLVGTTGLAGFFFALFTAVMSLKSSSKSAIVVKKY